MRVHVFYATAFKCLLSVAAILLPAVTTHAFSKDLAPAVVELGSGYIVDVQSERAEEEQEIVLMEKPDSLNKPNLHDVIFNSTLTAEFMFNYQNQFGQTEQEQYYYLTSRQGYYRSPQGNLTATREDDQRKAFALYMMKRLGEYHVDNYMKTEPNMRRIYEIKQAVSQVKVTVAKAVKFDFNYNYSSNQARASCQNPVADAWVVVQMDPNQFYPGTPLSTGMGLQRSITDTIGAETQYLIPDKMVKGIVTKQFSPVLSGNVTAVTFLQDRTGSALLSAVDSTTTTKESFFLLGGSLAF